MKCEYFIDCFFSCQVIVALLVFFLWLFFTYKEALKIIGDSADDNNAINNIDKYIQQYRITGVKAYLLRCFNYDKQIINEKKEDLLKIANTLIETAKNHETITFSGLCEKALEEEWKGRKWLNYIARRLDIIGHCCAYDTENKKAYEKIDDCFPFINGLTREKYSYKINSGFWQPFWKGLLPIKLYEEQTEENVKDFQKQIYDKIVEMEKEKKIDWFLEKLKTFEPTYEDLKKNNKS